MVKTTYENETDLLIDLMGLYGIRQFDLDPCYSTGRIWTFIDPKPKFKFDIKPQLEDVFTADCRNLDYFERDDVNSIFFDPPFLIRNGKSNNGLMAKRFSSFKSKDEMLSFLTDSLVEFKRILADGGVLVVKCQDTIDSHVQIWTHVEIMRRAEELGLFCHDLVILINENVIHDRSRNQVHARKTHSYFLVFVKNRKRLD